MVFGEDGAVFVVSGRTDTAQRTFSQRGFAHARLAHQKRIVFAAAAQYLYQPLHFVFAAD